MTPPRVGDQVKVRADPFEDDLPMVKATVTIVLAAQFIAEWPIYQGQLGRVFTSVTRQGFFLFTGKGTTWKSIS